MTPAELIAEWQKAVSYERSTRERSTYASDLWCSAKLACAAELSEVLAALPAAGQSPEECPPSLVTVYLHRELVRYLDTLVITGDNIGEIRRRLFMPWDSKWNGIVRDETASREKPNVPESAPAGHETPAQTKLDLVSLMQSAKAEVQGSPLYRKFIDGTPLENDIHCWMANFALAAVKAHGQHVADFLNELYAVMVDPCAEGTIPVKEMKAALLKAAIRDRDASVAAPAPPSEVQKP